jgi:hypothetical protein
MDDPLTQDYETMDWEAIEEDVVEQSLASIQSPVAYVLHSHNFHHPLTLVVCSSHPKRSWARRLINEATNWNLVRDACYAPFLKWKNRDMALKSDSFDYVPFEGTTNDLWAVDLVSFFG